MSVYEKHYNCYETNKIIEAISDMEYIAMECIVSTSYFGFDRELWFVIIAIIGTLFTTVIGVVLGWFLSERGKKKKIIVLGKAHIKARMETNTVEYIDPEFEALIQRRFGGQVPRPQKSFYEENVQMASAKNIHEAERLFIDAQICLYNPSIENNLMCETRLIVQGVIREVDSFTLAGTTLAKSNGAYDNVSSSMIDFAPYDALKLSLTFKNKDLLFSNSLKSKYMLRFGKTYLCYMDKNNKKRKIKIGKFRDIF